ncbi:unnamed protein product [Clavelina lepadiformis]|uniref:Uncharacterized protein n=1 Tax=Clavelina lepadiformis TaxID=159417 RepID=A0ABP0GSV2_CLALP
MSNCAFSFFISSNTWKWCQYRCHTNDTIVMTYKEDTQAILFLEENLFFFMLNKKCPLSLSVNGCKLVYFNVGFTASGSCSIGYMLSKDFLYFLKMFIGAKARL